MGQHNIIKILFMLYYLNKIYHISYININNNKYFLKLYINFMMILYI